MKTRTFLALIAGLGLLACMQSRGPVVVAQDNTLIQNPDLYMPSSPVKRVEDNVMYKIREARQREIEALRLEHQGKKDEAFDRWRDAFGRYQQLRDEHLKDDLPFNSELLVRAEWFGDVPEDRQQSTDFYAETWVPLADYINARFRIRDWPQPLRNRLSLQQSAKGAEMLSKAVADDDPRLMRRCARFYQFSPAGRTALKLLASAALENADSVSAVRWLDEYRESWPDEFERDGALHVQYARACRDAGMNYRLGRFLRQLERSGFSAKVDVGGSEHDSQEFIRAMVAEPAPAERVELTAPGWRTLQGNGTRNGTAPPVVDIGAMVNLGATDEPQGFKLVEKLPGIDRSPDEYSGEETPPMPVVFPAVHESGFFIHRMNGGDKDNFEKLMWFRQGAEGKPTALEVKKSERYTLQQGRNNRGWWGRGEPARARYRVMGSSISRVRWDIDNRETDLLVTILGAGAPTRDKTTNPTGNQIQAFDLGADAALRVTMPNKKVEPASEWEFLQHVIFSGVPLVRDGRLYVAGCYTAKDSFEVWMFCFGLTPKADPAEGEGKLLWRTQLCAKKLSTHPWAWGNEPVQLPEVSSVAEQGGMLYCSTHTGATAAVDRVTGELCWVSRYGRQQSQSVRGWIPNAPIAACGFVVTAPYDYALALVLDAVTGLQMMEYPVKGKGATGEFEHVLGVLDNRMLVQGRTGLHSIELTSFRKGGARQAEIGGRLQFQAEYAKGDEPTGRGVIAGDSVLVPFGSYIAVYDVQSGKLRTRITLDGVRGESLPSTLTVYCRGEAYKDEHGITRYRAATVTDPSNGTVYNVDHLRNGDSFVFPSGESAVVKKETFVILSTAQWVYLFQAQDGGK